jgi:carboxypeptidase Taq
MSFQKLDDLCRRLEALEHALAILGADEATHMAVGGGEKRAEAMAALSGMYHRQATAPEIGDWIHAAERETLNEDQAAALREFRRHHTNLTCLPADFVERQTAARLRCEQLWRDLRAKGDWTSFQPALEGVVALAREEAAMRAEVLGLSPYDALMEQYDPGNRTADITPVFTDLKAFLKDFVPQALDVQAERLAERPQKPLSGNYSIDRQRALGLAMMEAVGFDLTRGSLSVSHHPFCGGVPSDVRITTRRTGHTGRSARRAAWPSMKARACSWKSRSAATPLSGAGRCLWWTAISAKAGRWTTYCLMSIGSNAG